MDHVAGVRTGTMHSNTSPSSRSSLVSLDPTIVSHITSTTRSGHTRTGSTPVHPGSTSNTGYTKGHGRTVSAPSKHGHKRSNSLRRAKNSTEMLRQRSKRDAATNLSRAPSDSKGGRSFKVTNVGMGGMLYLRPSSFAKPGSPNLSTLPSTPRTAPATTVTMPPLPTSTSEHTAQHQPSANQGVPKRTRSVSPKRLLSRLVKSKEAQREPRLPHGRSQSFSTIDESRKSITSSWPKTLKIIINRIDTTRPEPVVTDTKPTLEIPIPHYRLGVPRFSIHGTPMLRSSVFSRDSSNLSLHRVSGVKQDTYGSGPPPASLKAFAKIQGMESDTGGVVGDDNNPLWSPNVGRTETQRQLKGLSIALPPAVFDDLNQVYNDSSVVRFAHDVRDVTAATPARIIAQISSESFMDYELVSEFFLTFRSYMSTADVLDLLLARLAWAICRMSDDGRIIRIRTFAALRHWILNYFLDDFVPNRNLRARFCDEVNDLHSVVRSKHVGGPSDLKILQDLKRCWNGRCLLYWDGDYFNMDSLQETDLHPGGVIGSRNPDYTNVIEIDEEESIEDLPLPQSAPAHIPEVKTQATSPPTPKTAPLQHARPKPSTTASAQKESWASDQSIQPHSCSILYTGVRASPDGHKRLQKPHPVSVLERRLKAPSDLKVLTNRSSSSIRQHKRGGSSFDSTRVRTPVVAEPPVDIPWSDLNDGSIIRGFAYAPVEPFVQIPAQMPHSPAGPYGITEPTSRKRGDNSDSHVSTPTVRNVFGSIRRALSGKHGPNEMAFITISGPVSTASLAPRKSQLPLNVSRSQDELRRRVLTAPPRSPIRIDLLCAAAIESYQASVPTTDLAAFPEAPLEILKNPSAPREDNNHLTPNAAQIDRIRSRISSQSGSIVIIDGTGLGIPAMSGALDYPQPHVGPSTEEGSSPPEQRHTSFETQIAFEEEGGTSPSGQEEMHFIFGHDYHGEKTSEERLVLDSTAENQESSTASSTTVKHRRSLASSVAQANTQASLEETASTVTGPPDEVADEDNEDTDESAKQPPQMLRRRPGGDLRKNQNVHDLESTTSHHESLDSLAHTVSSAPESLLVMSNVLPVQPYAIDKMGVATKNGLKHVSMINTHSSQHLRPSFEAAVAGFSAIPDDDDGGLEATLLKLEGRYDKGSPEFDAASPSPSPISPVEVFLDALSTLPRKEHEMPTTPRIVQSQYDDQRMLENASTPRIHQGYHTQRDEHTIPIKHKPAVIGVSNTSAANSAASLPLLQRTSAAPSGQSTPVVPPMPLLAAVTPPRTFKGLERQELPGDDLASQHDGSTLGIRRSVTAHTELSFLLDEDEDFSDLSSEMSVAVINYSEAMGNASSPLLVAPGTAISGLEIPSHPLAHSSFVDLTMQHGAALDGNPEAGNKPLSPEPVHHDKAVRDKKRSARTSIPIGPAHVPYILACDSQILAQQFTLVEQSALTEIEWSDLVEMRWSSEPAKVLDWAEYVTKQDGKGVDIVITRFNLMVKWALSEIVLTQDIDERVRVITKLIHVAAHARRLHNYATMLQITIALTTSDCTRLAKTWQQVPEPDKSLLKNMETLIQPIRNFNDLRVEMESADLTDGCIPFIGLYVHDLTYNAQKPAEIEPGRHNPPLINFERFRTAAVIVKGLLRLIDASSRYEFEPIHGIIERCLWIASLDDDRIRSLSKALET